MNMRPKRILRFLIATARLGVIVLLASVLFGQGKSRPEINGLPTDWTSRSVIFSNENSPPDFVLQDPRFWLQYFRRHGSPFNQGTSPLSAPAVVRDQDGLNARQFDPGNCQGPKCQPPSPDVDWSVSLGSGNGVANDMFPAKFTFDVNAPPSCTNDFLVVPVDANGAANQANLIGFKNLYTNTSGTGFCTGLTAPSVKWSYRVGTKMVQTSPVLSLDGAKVAFIDSNSPPNFYVLTPGTGTECGSPCDATHPVQPGVAPSNAVLVTVPLTGVGAASTRSSPFVDYSGDAAYVGTDNGKLTRIKNVFSGTPSVDWSLQLTHAGTNATILTGPVFDASLGKVFVCDDKGFLYAASSAGSQLGFLDVSSAGAASGAFLDPPLLDSTNHTIFVFAGGDGTSAVAVQVNDSLTELARIRVGQAAGNLLHAGTFDDRYIRLGPASGFLYVVGKESATNGFANNNNKPALYRIGFVTNTLNCLAPGSACTVLTGALEISNNNGAASPLTELKNGTTDRLFVGVTLGSNNVGLCPFNAGCVENFDITLLMPTTTAAPAVSEAGGTSGIVVDNVSTAPEASSIYFGPLTANFIVKLTQSGLQ